MYSSRLIGDLLDQMEDKYKEDFERVRNQTLFYSLLLYKMSCILISFPSINLPIHPATHSATQPPTQPPSHPATPYPPNFLLKNPQINHI